MRLPLPKFPDVKREARVLATAQFATPMAAGSVREIRILTRVPDKRPAGTTAGQADLGIPARTNQRTK